MSSRRLSGDETHLSRTFGSLHTRDKPSKRIAKIRRRRESILVKNSLESSP